MSRSVILMSVLASMAMLLPGTGAAAKEGDCRDLFPQDPVLDVHICEDTQYLTGVNGGRVGNRDGITLTQAQPTSGDRTSGGVSVNVVPGSTFLSRRSTQYSHTVTGTFDGVIDSIAADLYMSSPRDAALGTIPRLRLRLVVDGTAVFDNYDDLAQWTHEASVTIVNHELQIVHLHFTDLYDNINNNVPGASHTVTLMLTEAYYGDGNNVVYYANGQTPSSMFINPVTTFATKIKV